MDYIQTKKLERKTEYLTNVKVATPTMLAQASRLAKNVDVIEAGIFSVGESIVDTWRGACSCLQWRNHNRYCAHKVALYLALGVDAEHKLLPEVRKYYLDNGITQPKIIGYTCRLRNTRGRWQYTGKCYLSDWLTFDPIGEGDSTFATLEDVTHFRPEYENG